MRLDYFWIKDYKNIEEQGFNLGSEYIYSISKNENEYTLERRINDQFIKDFYSINNVSLENASALIGSNGSGKSNTLDFLRKALSGRLDILKNRKRIIGDVEYFLILTEYRKNGTLNTYIIKSSKNNIISKGFKSTDFSHIKESEVVFYSPIYDFRNLPVHLNNYGGVDVSSNFLINKDLDDLPFRNADPIENHKYKNVLRQLQFIEEFQNNAEIKTEISFPKTVEIIIHEMDIFLDGSRFTNVPYQFREFYDLLIKTIWRRELKEITEKEYNSNKAQKKEATKAKFFTYFLYYLWKNLFYNIENDNHFLKRKVYKKLENLQSLSVENFIITFLESQKTFNAELIKAIINEFKELLQHVIEVENNNDGTKVITVPINKISNLLSLYDKYLKHLYYLSGNSKGVTFLSFNLHGLSSGEKAYLDLFSRINYSRKLIQHNVEDESMPQKESLPKKIYILIDEGEKGFHLQWHKKYIYWLVKYLPLILKFSKRSSVKIQLIFTSHSPISLSDIPSYNVIYIEKDKEGKCKVLQEDLKPHKSFAANLNELIHDSFFLKDGLIGDFAKDKINHFFSSVIDEKNELSPEAIKEADKLIKLVDEPLLKIKMSERLSIKTGRNKELERLKEQKKYIEDQISIIEKLNDKNRK